MDYIELAKVYEELEQTTKRLEKTEIISDFLKKASEDDLKDIIYLLEGRIFPQWDERKIGFSSRSIIKSISVASGETFENVENLLNEKGDLGLVAEELMKKKQQNTLKSKNLTVKIVIDNIRKLAELEGKGTVDKKIGLIVELLGSAKNNESKYVVKTVLENLRIGVSEGIIRDAISLAFDVDAKDVERAGNYCVDYGEVGVLAKSNKLKTVNLKPGRPFKVMLAVPSVDIEEIFKNLDKIQFEYKLDGFRLLVHKSKEVKLFTRRLENVTVQFPDVVKIVEENIEGDNFILDCEAVGIADEGYLPFQKISQRIRRKYGIEEMASKFPVELDVFDIVFYNNENLMNKPLKQRRELLEKIIEEKVGKIILTKKLVTKDEKEAQKFFDKSLSDKTEGLIAKNLNGEYRSGRYVNGWMKLKSVLEPLDVVIVGAEYGEGKRAGWLTSYYIAVNDNENFKEIGKVSSGLKEKGDGVTFSEVTEMLKPLILETQGKKVQVKPQVIIEVAYEEIQLSVNYDSGFAIRFPRILRVRNDKSDANSIKDVKRIYNSQKKN